MQQDYPRGDRAACNLRMIAFSDQEGVRPKLISGDAVKEDP